MIDYDIENDELVDVMNNADIPGLCLAVEEYCGFVRLYVVDSYTHESDAIVEGLCSEFGYDFATDHPSSDKVVDLLNDLVKVQPVSDSYDCFCKHVVDCSPIDSDGDGDEFASLDNFDKCIGKQDFVITKDRRREVIAIFLDVYNAGAAFVHLTKGKLCEDNPVEVWP